MTSKTLLLICVLFPLILSQSCTVSDPDKVDCGYYGINQQQCVAKGCCWQPASQYSFLNFKKMAPQDTPWCFFPAGYQVCGTQSFQATDPGFDTVWYGKMYDLYMKNIDIQGLGGVVAAPDANTPGGSYIYHWMRDAALTMRTYMEINNFNLNTVNKNMEAYVGWVLRVQNEPDPNGIDIRTEPKFNLPEGQPYTGAWCRPQNDGPGLRSITLMMWANALLDAGQTDFVKQNLWTGTSSYNGGAIKFDLDYVYQGYNQESCDLWEEVRSTDFFWNKMAFNRALTMGVAFATRMGDTNSANKYAAAQQKVFAQLGPHWTGSYVFESTNRLYDSAVIHAFVSNNDNVFDVTGTQVASTIKVLNNIFCQYPINFTDNKNNIPGVLFGRYPGDTYDGGNPWQLLSAALAEIFYMGAQVVNQRPPGQTISNQEYNDWKDLFKLSPNSTAKDFAVAAKSAGDAVMRRIYEHVKDPIYGFRIDEQIDKNTGAQSSAKGLTWSYANILRALYIRNNQLQNI